MKWRRRHLLAAVAALAMPSRMASASAPTIPRRIVSLDYGVTETLLMLGIVPVGMVQVAAWKHWVVDPPLPSGIVDIGTDREPNLELLSSIRPDLILTTPYLAALRPLLQPFAPTEEIAVYTPRGGKPYDLSTAATRHLGDLLGREAEAEALISRAEEEMAVTRAALAPTAHHPLLIVSFLDAQHLRIYGAGGLFDDVLERCGLVNGWRRPTSYWGFTTIGIEELAGVSQSRLVYLDPVAGDVLTALKQSALWNSFEFVRSGRIHHLPTTLMFGMLPSAMRFARLLREGMAGEGARRG